MAGFESPAGAKQREPDHQCWRLGVGVKVSTAVLVGDRVGEDGRREVQTVTSPNGSLRSGVVRTATVDPGQCSVAVIRVRCPHTSSCLGWRFDSACGTDRDATHNRSEIKGPGSPARPHLFHASGSGGAGSMHGGKTFNVSGIRARHASTRGRLRQGDQGGAMDMGNQAYGSLE